MLSAQSGDIIGFDVDLARVMARKLGVFKTSMLQDAQAGRGPLEIDALVASVREIGQHVGVPTPQIDALLGLVRLHAQTRGLY